MGLDISVYTNVKPYNGEMDGIYPIEGSSFIVNNDECFKDRALPLEYEKSYQGNPNIRYSFRAGSYGSYGQWRETIAKYSGYPLAEYKKYNGEIVNSYAAGAWESNGGIFWELINFSDCEGVLGSIVCKKLANDFEYNMKDIFKKVSSDYPHDVRYISYFKELYKNWMYACKRAAKNSGVIRLA